MNTITVDDNTITVDDVLYIIEKQARWCRENESDMRYIINTISSIRNRIKKGESREDILEYFDDDDDDE